MNKKRLQCLAVTADATIRQVFGDLNEEPWSVVVFDEAARLFSHAADEIHFLLLDESAVGKYQAIIKRVRKRAPAVDVMVVGGPKSDDVKLKEKREGVDYYFERPVEGGALSAAVRHRLEIAQVKASSGIVGRSVQIEEILEAILQVAPTEVTILIEGESGTGKDILAQAVHLTSRRREGPFVALNCGALAEGVLESELFGHERGSFTGAVSQRIGVFERANGGTIFLDEVGEMSANMQVRLLRVLETGEVLRVGGVKSFRVDARVIAATNKNLRMAVRHGDFREDLYYRLKGVNFYLPPLRTRAEDIPILIDHFVNEAKVKHGKDIKGIDSDALRQLGAYGWPGNVRELRNAIDTLVVLSSQNRISADLVATQLEEHEQAPEPQLPVPLHRSREEAERELIYASVLALHRDVREVLGIVREGRQGRPWDGTREIFSEVPGHPIPTQSLALLERSAIQEALRAHRGNRRKAAEVLGISERTLYRKIKEYGLV